MSKQKEPTIKELKVLAFDTRTKMDEAQAFITKAEREYNAIVTKIGSMVEAEKAEKTEEKPKEEPKS